MVEVKKANCTAQSYLYKDVCRYKNVCTRKERRRVGCMLGWSAFLFLSLWFLSQWTSYKSLFSSITHILKNSAGVLLSVSVLWLGCHWPPGLLPVCQACGRLAWPLVREAGAYGLIMEILGFMHRGRQYTHMCVHTHAHTHSLTCLPVVPHEFVLYICPHACTLPCTPAHMFRRTHTHTCFICQYSFTHSHVFACIYIHMHMYNTHINMLTHADAYLNMLWYIHKYPHNVT